ncbi:hypothetical protein G7Y79_00006g018700 [Physcia stellaris]|nr:hypothetical protein G7Y79_00006g018700 [Physcia stellaris]
MPETKGNFNYYAPLSGDKEYMQDNGYKVVKKTNSAKETSTEGSKAPIHVAYLYSTGVDCRRCWELWLDED